MLENVLKGLPIVLNWFLLIVLILLALSLVVTYPREAIWVSFGTCVFVIVCGFIGKRV